MMTGRQNWLMIVTFMTAVLNIGLSFALVQQWGIVGVAIAATVSIVLENLFLLIITRWQVGIWTNIGNIKSSLLAVSTIKSAK